MLLRGSLAFNMQQLLHDDSIPWAPVGGNNISLNPSHVALDAG